MNKFLVTVNYFEKTFKKMQVEYGEKEYSVVTQLVAGIVTDCLVAKKISIANITVEKIKNNDSTVLIYIDLENHSYRYVS